MLGWTQGILFLAVVAACREFFGLGRSTASLAKIVDSVFAILVAVSGRSYLLRAEPSV